MRRIKSTNLILLQAVLFVIFLLITSWFTRFSADDYHFIGALNHQSFKEIYQQLYFHWHGRWSSNFLLLLFLQFKETSYFLVGYQLFTFSFLFIGIRRCYLVLSKKYKLNPNFVNRFSLLLLGVLFFCTVSPNETWFWYTSSVVYLWSTIAFFFALSSYLNPTKNILDYLFLILGLSYIGGSNEPMAIFIGLFFVYQLIKKFRTQQDAVLDTISIKKIKITRTDIFITVFGLSILSSAFLLNYLSSGTLHRDEITPSLSFINLILYIVYGSIKYLFFQFHTTFLVALFFATPFYWLGKNTTYESQNFKPLQQLGLSILIIGISIFINQSIVITALGGLSPDRAMMITNLIIAFVIVRYLFLLGVTQQQQKQSIQPLFYLNIIALIGFNIIFFAIHKNYTKAVDDRIIFIKKPDNNGRIIEVKPLPNSGYIYSAEISEDKDNFKNQHLKEGLGIKNKVILKKE